ncbi:MAG TPA: PDZ domain-containing protein [Chthoniobacterales bacterium]|nr:PDZ domain-containing protein [Chthoniobacterales bacterium]
MNTKSIATIATIALLPIAGFAQTPPSPPPPPAPPIPPDRHEKMPKVPVTFLGVETSEVPSVVSEQLGLAKGFGLVVDYVVPDGPAAAAGVQQNDILKMLNDQILTEPDQLSKLVRSYSEGTNVTLTVLRKGQEQKITVKLTKKEVPQRREFGPGRHRHEDFPFGDFGMNGDFKEQMENLKEQLGAQKGMIHDAVVKAREEAMRARDQAREQARRAVEEARRAAGRWNITTNEDGGLKTTKIDIGKAQIVFSDDKGEMKLETVDGKKLLTAKDPQGKLLFSGPVETKEDFDKIPAEVRQRYDKLQEEELRAVAPPSDTNEDGDSADTNDDDNETLPMEQVSTNSFPRVPLVFRSVPS